MGIIEDEIARQNASRAALAGANVSNDGALAGRMGDPRALAGASVSNDGTLAQRFQAPDGPRALAGVNVSSDGALAQRIPTAPSMSQPSVDPRTLSGVNVSNSGDLARETMNRARVSNSPIYTPPAGGGSGVAPAPDVMRPALAGPGPIRAAAGSISSAAGKAVGAMQSVNGQVIDGAKDLGRMAASAGRNPVVQGIGRTAGVIAGGMTGGLAVDNIREGNTALGAAQGALAASSLLPGPIGTAGRMANVGYQAIVGSGVYDKGKALVQQWLNGGQQASAPVAAAAPVASAAGTPNINPNQSWDGINAQNRATQGARDSDRLILLNAELAKATDPQQIAWLKTEIAAAQKAGGVVPVAAPGGATRTPGPVQRAGAAIAEKLPAGSKQIMPPFAGKDADGPFWLFKRADGTTYKDRPDPDYIPPDNVVMRADGSRHIVPQSAQGPIQRAAAETGDTVEILRGLQRSAISFGNGAPGSTREWRTDLPVLASGSLQDRLNYVAELYGKEGAQVGDAAARLLLGDANNQTSLGVANIQGSTSRDVAGTQAGAHIRGAEISAAAQRYGIDAKPDIPQVKEIEEPVIGADGKPVIDRLTNLPARQKRSVQWNGAEWVPVRAKEQPRIISKADYARIAKELGDPKRVEQYLKSNNIVVQ